MIRDLISERRHQLVKERSKAFVDAFMNERIARPKLVFGRNVYGDAILEVARVDAFIDDYTSSSNYKGVPILKSTDIPRDALVLAVAGGRPLSVKCYLDAISVEHLDYFAFRKAAKIALPPLVFNVGFETDIQVNLARYEWVYERLVDPISKDIFRKLILFRLYNDIRDLHGFVENQENQYFEKFLGLNEDGEVFYDIGCFDGTTSLMFARRYPAYRAIHAFEPDPTNINACVPNLKELERLHLHPFGLSTGPAELALTQAGSASFLGQYGGRKVRVVDLDSLSLDAPTFIKVDIEGGELNFLRGAAKTIAAHRPILAMAIYHYSNGDAPFWQIPEAILKIAPDYSLHLRHYTESIYETVMFFVPNSRLC